MSEFQVHDADSAPEGGREAIEAARRAFGFTPNLIGVMSEAPALARAYLSVSQHFGETSLSPQEQQIVLVTVSRHNSCEYCVAAHSTVGEGAGISEQDLEALRSGGTLADPRHEALRVFVSRVVLTRGWVEEADLQAFFDAGFEKRHVLEVILGVGMKTLSNYTNHVAHTPLDRAFEKRRWEPAA